MTEQADLSAAYDITDWNARGDFVYKTLLEYAAQTQKPVLAYLQEHGYKYQSFFAGNEVYVYSGDLVAVQAFDAMPEVGSIDSARTYYIDLPGFQSIGPQQQTNQEDIGVIEITPTITTTNTPRTFEPTGEQIQATYDWGINDTKAPQFWAGFGIKGDGILVASIDSGVQWNHPALVNQYKCASNPTSSVCWYDPSNTCAGTVCDNVGHGTHTMGTMVGKDDPNLSYIVGMAPNAQWITCKGCESSSCSSSSLLACADWILAPGGSTANRPKIVNNSWGGGGGDSWYLTKVNAWRAAGIFPAFSSGNPGSTCGLIGSPSDYQESFASGGYDSARNVYTNSGRGPSAYGHDPYTKPNISGPAVSVISSYPTNSWASMTGTSMASPHTAGTVALLWSCNPSLVGNIDATFQLLQNNTDTPPAGNCGVPPDGQGNYTFGYGYLNALKVGIAGCSTAGVGTLTGTITSSGSPLANAVVTVNNTTAITNGSGVYSMNMTAGTYTASATKHGYSTGTASVTITVGYTTTQDFNLTTVPATTVSGTVTDGSGLGGPLAANILITSPGFSQNIYTSDGTYSVSLYQQTDYIFTINAIASGYREKKIALTFSSTPVTRNFALEVYPVSCSAPGYRPGYTYYQDFETSNGGFTLSGSSWSYGAPISGPGAAHSGVKVWATNLTGTYPNYYNGSITSPNINLSSLAGKSILIHWWQWLDTESCCDSIYVYASKDGGSNYTQIYTQTGYDWNWKRQQIILDSSYAVSNFRIRFAFISDLSVVYSGYYLDDIGIGGVSPINESFEGATFPPTGWSIYDLDWGGTTWASSTTYARTGSKSAKHGYYTSSNQNGWLVSPDILIDTGNGGLIFWEYTYYLTYYRGHYGWWCDEASIGGCGSPPFNYSIWSEFFAPVQAWRSQSIGIGASLASHTIRLAWQYTGLDGDDWYIDDFSLSDPNDLPPLACNPISDAHLTYTPPSLSATVDLGAAPSSTSLTIANVGLNTASFNINEYNLGFVPSVASQTVSIPAFTGEIEHSPASIGPAPAQQAPAGSETGKQPQVSELSNMLNGINAYALDIDNISHVLLVSFNTSTPGTLTTIGDLGTHSFFAGDFLNGDSSKLYTLDYSTNHLYSVNTSTAALTDIGAATPLTNHAWTGMTGGMNGVLYASSASCSAASEIYTINTTTGAATPLFNVTNSTCLIDIAMNANGELYGVDIASDKLIQINLNNGVGTPIGSLGIDVNWAQGLSFDQLSGVLYWAAYSSLYQGQLRMIDTVTGASALVGAFPNNDEVDSLAFPTNGSIGIPWLSENPTMGGVSGGSNVPVVVTFIPPTQISQLGTYTGQLKIGNDTNYGTGIVPVTMVVQIPNTWGWVQGTVTGLAECDGAGSPIAGARIEIRDMSNVLWGTTYTNASGFYHYPALAGSYNITATHLNYIANLASGIAIPSGRGISTLDFTSRRNLPCINPNPTSLSASLFVGNTTTQGLTLNNTGAGVGTAMLLERPGSGSQTNLLLDPSVEIYAPYPTSPWQQYSLNVGTVLWTYSGGGSGPHTGDVFAWFGGISSGLEEGYLKQTITIPSGTASLDFWLATPYCANGAADYMVAQVDGVEIFRVNGTAPTCGDGLYYPQTVNLSAYANGAAHEVKFFSHTIGGSLSNFMVDDVAVESPGWSNVTWLSESPIYTTIPHDSSTSANITFDAAGMAPGIFNATLIFENLPKQTINFPVSMTVGGAPSGLTATTISQTQINLSWTDNSSNEDGFKVERSPDGTTNWVQIGTTGSNVATYQDTTVT
jgi:hypothetical protein